MKMITKSMALTVLSLCVAISTLCAACVGAPVSVQETALSFTDVQGKEWELIEVRIAPQNIPLDRVTLAEEGFADVFTLSFDAGQLQGKGVPNRYRGPYEAGEGQSLKIKNIAATLMAAFREPEGLKEYEYFAYLQNTYRWNIDKGNLELFTKNEDGREAVLVYTAE